MLFYDIVFEATSGFCLILPALILKNCMKKNKILVGIVLIIMIFSSCKNDTGFTVEGKITHSEGNTIYLEEVKLATSAVVDSTKINQKGEFKLKAETLSPSFYKLAFSDNKYIYLLVDSAENITVNADYVNFSREYDIAGSLGSILLKELNEKLNNTRHKLDSIKALDKLYRGNPDYGKMKVEWNESRAQILEDQVKFSENFVLNNPFSMASIFALYQKFYNTDRTYIINNLQIMKTAASALHSIYPESEHVKSLYANTVQLNEEERMAKIQQFIQENGENSPDIILPNPDGEEIALSSLRGKVVLLQFWSAEDRGSRILNQVLTEAYAKYKNKDFEIYQVSIDENRIEWVDAIDKDELSWINVGDMEGSAVAASTYNVKSIPYNYLLDKDGVIIAQNLKGPALNRALNNLLN